MKYFIDTEFLEGPQKTWWGGKTKPTIDLISIGIVSEDDREYYAISKDFNLKEAWNRYDDKVEIMSGDMRNRYPEGRRYKDYWIRENVLRPIFMELADRRNEDPDFIGFITGKDFTYKNIKSLIHRYGKSNEQIAKEIKEFVVQERYPNVKIVKNLSEDRLLLDDGCSNPCTNLSDYKPTFYAYFADYDWITFCWLFGRMIDLPKGFPKYCRDLKQMLDDKADNKEWSYHRDIVLSMNFEKDRPATLKEKLDKIETHYDYPKQTNEHHALADARWNKELHKFIESL